MSAEEQLPSEMTDDEDDIKEIHEEDSTNEEEDESDSEDWEEVTMVVTVNGILDADLVRDAVERDLIKLRYGDTDVPVLQVIFIIFPAFGIDISISSKLHMSSVQTYFFQINNSLYTAAWNQDLGTNIVLQSKGKEMEVVSCTSTMMAAEKALLTSLSTEGSTIAAKAEVAPRAALSRTQPRGQ